MTFWPLACCYCDYCRERFDREVGGEIPKIIDWFDPRWTAFQRKREQWLNEFAAYLTDSVRAIKPDLSVEHQSSTIPLGWGFGVSQSLAQNSDFLQGDFYGDALQGSLARKLLYGLTPNLPYGFETSACVNINDHTARKSKDLLRAKAFAAIADGGAFVFIDGIDPVGTLNKNTYEVMGQIFSETKPYEPYLGGTMVQDVAVYLSTESKCDFADNGKPLVLAEGSTNQVSPDATHVDAVLGAVRTLIDNNIPYGVITKSSLSKLSDYKVLILPNVLMMSEDEVEAVREYVRAGGCAYASKWTSLVTSDGHKNDDFMLADVFGVSYKGETPETFTYIYPENDLDHPFAGYTVEHPMGLSRTQMLLDVKPEVEVIGRLALPYDDCVNPLTYSSIHSNPPGRWTENASVTIYGFGKGKAMYCAADMEMVEHHRESFANMIRLLRSSFTVESDAPKAVEITTYYQQENNRYTISLLNFQKELPNISVENISVRVNTNGRRASRLVRLPNETEMPFVEREGRAEFVVPRLETFEMVALELES